MKLKNAFLFMALICQMAYGMKYLETHDSRRDRWIDLNGMIRELRNATEDVHLGIPSESVDSVVDIAGKGDSLTEYRREANVIIIEALKKSDEWLSNILNHDQFKQDVKAGNPEALALWRLVTDKSNTYKEAMNSMLTEKQYSAFQQKRDAQIRSNIARAGALPLPLSAPAPSTSFLTPKRKKYAIGAAIVIALGTLYKKAPQWMKSRVKRILAEHDKTLADVTPAEQDLLISASYARFNPAGSFFFQEAVLDMPKGQTFREELWPVLYHVYYGKKKVGQKRRAELRKLYDEAQEMVGVEEIKA